MLQITADMFSGRPNPTWTVDPGEAADLLQQIGLNRPAIGDLNEGLQGLGYRGLIVELLSDNLSTKYDLPSTFRMAHNSDPKGLELADRIFASMQKSNVLDGGLHRLVIDQLQQLGLRDDETQTDSARVTGPSVSEAPSADVTCQIELGAFNPAFWNDAAHIMKNNCYNYASNRRTDTFAQPGRATGHQATVMACANVTAGAISDGLHHRFNCFPASEKPRWLMALVVAPNYDYHWYRKQKEGFWGHKPGGTAARNTDNNGVVIANPETAARGPYTNFCGYFYACKSQKIK